MKHAAAVFLTVLVLVALYTQIDLRAMAGHFRNMSMGLFVLGVLFFLPQVLVTAVRWGWMVRDAYPAKAVELLKLVVAGKALNALLPSKLGEASKAYFLKTRANVPLTHGVALVVLEKVFDVAGLCALLLVGVLLESGTGLGVTVVALAACGVLLITGIICTGNTAFARRWLHGESSLAQRVRTLLEAWDAIMSQWRKAPARFAGILLSSVFLWVLHLMQIALFFEALGSQAPLRAIFAYVPISIFVGLLPVTIGGMGTRDSALILLFAPYDGAALMAGVGILCSLRYWLDSLVGLPFFHAYSTK